MNACISSGTSSGELRGRAASRHSLNVAVNPGAELREIIDQMRLSKQETPSRRPNPEHYFDGNNGDSKKFGPSLASTQAAPGPGTMTTSNAATEKIKRWRPSIIAQAQLTDRTRRPVRLDNPQE